MNQEKIFSRNGDLNLTSKIRVPQKFKLKKEIKLRDFNFTSKQQELLDIIFDKKTQIVFVEGSAGVGKTLLAVYAGLKLLNEKKVSDIIYVRSIIESASRSIGSLPGLLGEKFEPFTMPLYDKLEEILSKGDIKLLESENRIKAVPINFLRGANFNAQFIIGEEQQNSTLKEITTLLTRLGKHSKMILCGDTFQSDLNGKSGAFAKTFELFNDYQAEYRGIRTFKFNKEDIMRNELIGFILDKLETLPQTKNH